MSKMTKMQLNRVNATLNNIAAKKVDELKCKLTNPLDLLGGDNYSAIGRNEAVAHPLRLIKIIDDHQHGGWHVYSYCVYECMPSVAKLKKKVALARQKNEDSVKLYRTKLGDEVENIMTGLYLADSADALAIIEQFKEL